MEKFIDSKTIYKAERKSLRDKKVADQKLRHLLTIIADHCNRHDLQSFKTFIDILRYTNNVDIAQQLSLIYKERVRSSHLMYKFRVRTDLIYMYIYTFILITKLHGKEINIKHTNIFTTVSERK